MIITDKNKLRDGHFFSFVFPGALERYFGVIDSYVLDEEDKLINIKIKEIPDIKRHRGNQLRTIEPFTDPLDFACTQFEEMKNQFPEEFV